MSYDDIYPTGFQGLAANGFELALIGTVDIDDKRICDFIVLFTKLVYYFVYIENFKLVNDFLLGLIRPSFIHLLTDAWVVFIHLAK